MCWPSTTNQPGTSVTLSRLLVDQIGHTTTCGLGGGQGRSPKVSHMTGNQCTWWSGGWVGKLQLSVVDYTFPRTPIVHVPRTIAWGQSGLRKMLVSWEVYRIRPKFGLSFKSYFLTLFAFLCPISIVWGKGYGNIVGTSIYSSSEH